MKDEAQEVLFLSVPSLDLPHYSFLLQDRLNVAGPPCYLVYRYIRGKSIFSIVQSPAEEAAAFFVVGDARCSQLLPWRGYSRLPLDH